MAVTYTPLPKTPPPNTPAAPAGPVKGILELTPADIQGKSSGKLGYLDDLLSHLDSLKAEVAAGRLPLVDYISRANDFAKTATLTLNQITTTGSNNATQAKNRLTKLREYADLNSPSGQGDFKDVRVPFNQREIATLPQNVIPTSGDLLKYNLPVDMFPSGTPFRSDPQPQFNPGPDGSALTPPPGVSIPDPANPGKIINVPLVGDPLKSSVSKVPDQLTIEQEATRQAEQQRQAYEAQNALSTQRMAQLKDLLTQQEDQQFNENKTGIYEDLNSRGLLRSSELGAALGREKAKLAATTNNQLSQTALSDTDRQVKAISDILAQQQSFQTSGLERRFTLEDFNREASLSQQLGSQYAPQVKGGSSVLSGVLGGAGSGAMAGKTIGGPWGAGIGAVLGGVSGGSAAKGK